MTVIRARQLRLNTETRVAEAIDSVTVERDTLHARADYALFDDDARARLAAREPARLGRRDHGDAATRSSSGPSERELERGRGAATADVDYRGDRARHDAASPAASPASASTCSSPTRRSTAWSRSAMRATSTSGAPQRGEDRGEEQRAQGDTITVFFEERQDRPRARRGQGARRVSVRGRRRATRRRRARDRAVRRRSASSTSCPRNQIVLEPTRAPHLPRARAQARGASSSTVEQQSLVASGNPELVDRGDKVTGHLMTYDLESRVGNIYQARDRVREGALPRRADPQGGRQRARRAERLVQHVQPATSPHYHFQAQLDEDLPQGQAGGEAGGVLRQERPAARAARSGSSRSSPGATRASCSRSSSSGSATARASSSATPATTGRRTTTWTSRSRATTTRPSRRGCCGSRATTSCCTCSTANFRGSYARNERDSRPRTGTSTPTTRRSSAPRTRLVGARVSSSRAATTTRATCSAARCRSGSTASSPRASRSRTPPTGRASTRSLDRRQDLDADESIERSRRRRARCRAGRSGTVAVAAEPHARRSRRSRSSFPTRAIGSARPPARARRSGSRSARSTSTSTRRFVSRNGSAGRSSPATGTSMRDSIARLDHVTRPAHHDAARRRRPTRRCPTRGGCSAGSTCGRA